MQLPWFLLFSSSALIADEHQQNHKHTTDEAQLTLDIEVECNGVDWDNLGLQALSFSAKALEETYNQVHESMDGGDVFLVGSHFKHVIHKKKRANQGDFVELLHGSQEEFWSSNQDPKEDMLEKVDICRRCFRDCPPRCKKQNGGSGGGYYEGGWGCYLCPEDDTTGGTLLMESHSDMRAWESAFTAALQESKHTELAKATGCQITLHPKEPLTDMMLPGSEEKEAAAVEGNEMFSLRGMAVSAA